jgi:hypothetical protein
MFVEIPGKNIVTIFSNEIEDNKKINQEKINKKIF